MMNGIQPPVMLRRPLTGHSYDLSIDEHVAFSLLRNDRETRIGSMVYWRLTNMSDMIEFGIDRVSGHILDVTLVVASKMPRQIRQTWQPTHAEVVSMSVSADVDEIEQWFRESDTDDHVFDAEWPTDTADPVGRTFLYSDAFAIVLGAGEVSAFAIEDRLAVGLDADGRMREFILHGLTVKEVKAFETYYARRRR